MQKYRPRLWLRSWREGHIVRLLGLLKNFSLRQTKRYESDILVPGFGMSNVYTLEIWQSCTKPWWYPAKRTLAICCGPGQYAVGQEHQKLQIMWIIIRQNTPHADLVSSLTYSTITLGILSTDTYNINFHLWFLPPFLCHYTAIKIRQSSPLAIKIRQSSRHPPANAHIPNHIG